jgi:hypothetical protein
MANSVLNRVVHVARVLTSLFVVYLQVLNVGDRVAIIRQVDGLLP